MNEKITGILKGKTGKTVLLAVLAVLLVAGGIFIGTALGKGNAGNTTAGDTGEASTAQKVAGAQDYTGNQSTYTGQKNTGTIDIPGFDTMTFQAGKTEQSVNLYNPEKNTCYFKISILLSDGTKLYESELLEPGKAFYTIIINEALKPGTYEEAVLKYECYKMDEAQTPLNGAETVFTLQVLE